MDSQVNQSDSNTDVTFYLDNLCLGKAIRVDIRTDIGAYIGSLIIDTMDIIFPLPMSPRDFEGYRRLFFI